MKLVKIVALLAAAAGLALTSCGSGSGSSDLIAPSVPPVTFGGGK